MMGAASGGESDSLERPDIIFYRSRKISFNQRASGRPIDWRRFMGNKTLMNACLPFLLVGCLNAQSIGSQAPAFTGVTAEQKEIRLSDHAGRVVLLDIWASWCGPCKEEMPFLVQADSAFRDLGLTILAVNIDKDPKNAAAFISGLKRKPLFPILLDGGAKIPPLYKLDGMPTTVLIDRKGVIRFRHTGFKSEKKDAFWAEIRGLLNEK
jgi:thiol-disulfide isomerase/thioredoxin